MAEAIPKDLLEILVCPETHQPLAILDADRLAALQRLQAEGRLVNRAGEPVADRFEAALVREDGRFAYLVVEQIPVMLVEAATPLDQVTGDA